MSSEGVRREQGRSAGGGREASAGEWLVGGGELGALIRSTDWSRTPLGPRDGWPPVLRILVGTVVESGWPMAVLWGPDLLMLYNEAYREIAGERHPEALARPAREVWPEIWPTVGPMLKAVMERGETVYAEDQPLAIRRDDRTVEACFTFAYSPVRDETGAVVGSLATVQETTARMEAEQELRADRSRAEADAERSRELLAQVVERVPAMVTIYDPSIERFQLNDEFRRVLGWTEEDVSGQDPMTLFYPDPVYRRQVREFMESPGTAWKEFLVTGKDGSEVPSLWANARLSDDTRIGVGIDLRERKRFESELRAALEEAESGQRLLDALMENVPIGLAIAEAPDVRIRAVSRFGLEMTGRPRETLHGAGEHAVRWGVANADGTPAREDDLPITRATLKGEHVREEEWVLLRPDGERVPVLATGGPIRDKDGKIVGGVVGWQDITLRKDAEARLREREERLRLMVEATGIGVFDMYPKTGEVTWSRHAKANFGLPADALVDEEVFLKGLHPDDRERVRGLIEAALDPAGSGEYAAEYRTIGIADGKERWIAARGVTHFDADGNAERLIGFSLDITERKRAEERLREMDRRKDEFLAVLGHELRNPLAAIRNAAELMHLVAPEDARLQRAHLVLERQTAHMMRLVDDLLEVSRIARGKIELQREPVDVRALVERVMRDRGTPSVDGGLEIETELAGEPLWVEGDEVRLSQVVDNLVGNALKFTPPPGTVRVAVDEVDGFARIRVRDTGAGIRPEMLEQLFEPFQQEVQDSARGQGGLGLGLALAKGFVDLHGGSIQARSAGPGEGAEFEVRLPLAPRPEPVEPSGSSMNAPPRRIAVVEDHADAAMALQELLELFGHEVTVFSDASAALDGLRRSRPDIVLCDLGLPGMSGHEFARAVRRDPELKELPLVALSGYGQAQDRARAAEAGFDDHLTKPVDLPALDGVLSRVASSTG